MYFRICTSLSVFKANKQCFRNAKPDYNINQSTCVWMDKFHVDKHNQNQVKTFFRTSKQFLIDFVDWIVRFFFFASQLTFTKANSQQ